MFYITQYCYKRPNESIKTMVKIDLIYANKCTLHVRTFSINKQ